MLISSALRFFSESNGTRSRLRGRREAPKQARLASRRPALDLTLPDADGLSVFES